MRARLRVGSWENWIVWLGSFLLFVTLVPTRARRLTGASMPPAEQFVVGSVAFIALLFMCGAIKIERTPPNDRE